MFEHTDAWTLLRRDIEREIMSKMTYLGRQRDLLESNLRQHVPAKLRNRHAQYLRAMQNPDGGYSGREGESDLYYTAFGLWGLAILGELSETIGAKATHFLKGSWQKANHLVDFFSLLHSYRLLADLFGEERIRTEAMPDEMRDQPEIDWAEFVTAALETCRSGDGGYARTPGQKSGSTYATFLTVLCYEEMEKPLPTPEKLVEYLQTRRRGDGGFVELAPMRRSGTNPTSAAMAVLKILGASALNEPSSATPTVPAFLASLQSMDGGLRANTVVPVGDLLSTFTGLWTLTELEAVDQIDAETLLKFVLQLAQDDGSFRAGVWDDRSDVEYTFYGLGSLALLSSSVVSWGSLADG